jgi:RNA polymerase sigma factor (sigma-70 family)
VHVASPTTLTGARSLGARSSARGVMPTRSGRKGPRTEQQPMLPPQAPPPPSLAGGLGVVVKKDTTIEALVVARVTEAVGRGDGAAFEVLYRAWFERVYGMARGITRRDESFCLDVTQEVMLRVAKGLPRIETEGELAAWMGRAALSCAVDLMRRETRRRRREGAVARGESPVSKSRGTQGQEEELAWVVAELRKLPLVEQGLLMQRVANGSSLKEAGLSVGIGEQAAHGRVRRAMEKLRRLAREVFP